MDKISIRFEKLPESIQELRQSNNGLKQALRRLENGSKPTPRSWTYEQKSPDWVLSRVYRILDDTQDLNEIKVWDKSKSDKFGPQGESAPLSERLDSLNEYFVHLDKPQIVDDKIWKQAKIIATQRLQFNESGSPVTSKAVVDRGMYENKYDTSSGFPLFKRRKSEEARAHAIEHAADSIKDRYPCVLGCRASMGKTGTKARHIFMASMDVNVNGQRYQQPLQDYIRGLNKDIVKQPFFLPWEGWDKVQSYISNTWKSSFLKFGADYSKMDQHFNLYHGLEVYDVVKHYFKPQFWTELEQIIKYVFEVPIITNLGYIDQIHAMPSGSEWTNFLETLWNYIFTIYLELKYHLDFKLKMGIGDDQLYMFDENLTSTKSQKWLLDIIIKEFDLAGLPGNADKQEESVSETGFLQRHFVNGYNGPDGQVVYAGVYSLVRNITSQLFPEFYHNPKLWNWRMHMLRMVMIAENCNMHPCFEQYVHFLAKSNEHVEEFVRMSRSEMTKIEDEAKAIAKLVPNYVDQHTKKSLYDFDTMKVLRRIFSVN